MPPNESSSAVGRLAVALEEWAGAEAEKGGRSLAEAIANGDPDQLLFWYELLAEVPAEELQERLEPAQLQAALRAIQLIMQWEHAQAEELKETLEREAMETAEREERWLAEREELRAELNGVRGRITTSARMDDVHEALRAEIEALSAENVQLRQSGRERDRELSEQRDRADELEGRVHAAERERALLSSNQAQLEESIRELNRRLSTQSEASQRGAEWETRKLRQRNEQALILSEQVRELAAQNDELRAEVDRLSATLTEATELLCDNARRFVDFEEQFAEAEKQIELLGTDNHELREQLHQKEKALKERVDSVELSNREFADVVQAKDAQLERQRAQLQRAELEREELRVRLETARPDRQKEEELERLRLELVSATETARRLFGAAMAEEEGKPAAEGEEAKGAYRAGMELRLRLVQMDRELEEAEIAVRGEKRRAAELEQALEQKDLHIARLLADCQRYRKMAFGEREEEISHIEKQLEFRDKQIAQLNRRCSELQMELEQQMEEGEKRKKKVTIREEPANEQRAEEEPRMEVIQEEVEIVEETREIIQVVEVEEEEEQFRIEEMVEVDAREKGEEGPTGPGPEATVVIVPTPKRKSRQQLIREATDMNALHAEIKRLVHELEGRENELSRFHRLYAERELHLVEAMEREARMKRELEQFKALLLFSEEEDGDPLDRLDGSREEGGGGKTATEDAFNEARLRERVEVLELENMELRRFRENIAAEGDERDRRMAEGTRRMVYLAVQEAKLGRRVQIGQRLRATMAQELRTMKARLGRVLAGEESRMRHLALENEVKLFELARLQNALLHSVPVVEHNRLLREHKKLLRDKLLSLEDGGYASQEEAQQDDTIEQLYAPDSMNIGRTLLAPDSVSALQIRCRRLQEQNDVLNGQNDALQSETQKMAAELAELNAFLDDLEAETELKSMLANIERRFLQALREQFEAAEERESLRRELQRNERQSREAREQWMDERQKLVQTVGQLHAAVQHLNRDRVLGGVSISTVQLEALARRLREQRNRQTQLAATEVEIEHRHRELGAAERAQAAAREAMESVLANNAELDAVHASIQGYQLNVLTLSAELAQTRKRLEKSDRELRERYEELDELRSALAAFQVLQGVDLRALERQLETAPKEGNGQGGQEQRGHSSPIVSPSSLASDNETPLAQQEGPQGARTRVVVVDNTAEWQSQLELVREQARTAMESYKEQLDRREHTLDEYRQLVEQLRAELTAKVTSTAKPATNEEERSTGVNTVRSADELLAAGAREEQWERRVRTLERELHVVVEEKAELEYEKQRLVAEVARERERKKEQLKVRRRDAQVQVNIGGEGGDGRHGQGRGGTSAAKVTTAEENGVAEEYSPFEEEEEDEKEEQSGGEEGANEEGQEEGDGDSDGSDSGTVEDIQVAARSSNGRKGTALNGGSSSVSGIAAVRSRGSAGTRTLPPRVATATGNEMETLVLRHRNETRKLRMRLIELERRNRELSEQYTALRERSRLAMRPRVTGLSGEAGGAEGSLRRENERLQRQNAHLTKTLETHKEEAEKAADRMRRLEAQSKGSTEIWEERKRHEHAIGALKKRLAEATEHEREMRERLERRERHIEQLNREQSGRLLEGEQLKGALAQWRTEKAELERREKTHVMEKATLVERCRELTKRLEALVRENAKLQRRLKQNECSTEEAEMVKGDIANAETQTDGEQGNSGEGKESGRVLSAPAVKSGREEREQMMSSSSVTKGARRQSEKDPNLQQQQTLLLKQLRRAELLQRETLEKLEVLRNKHEKLVEDYNGLVELERRRGRREEEERARWERDESMGVALLRDKLAAKEREVENQRHKIIDLERKMWRMEMVATRD